MQLFFTSVHIVTEPLLALPWSVFWLNYLGIISPSPNKCWRSCRRTEILQHLWKQSVPNLSCLDKWQSSNEKKILMSVNSAQSAVLWRDRGIWELPSCPAIVQSSVGKCPHSHKNINREAKDLNIVMNVYSPALELLTSAQGQSYQ